MIPADAIQPGDGTDPPLGRRARKALAVRRALFTAGLDAFEREPVGLVSVLDITEAADVAKGVFYLHFRSKDEYLLALWEDVRREFLDGLRAATAGRQSPGGRIEAAVDRYFALARDARAVLRFWIRMSGYFPEEVGEPGRLADIRGRYAEELAAILADVEPEQLEPRDVRVASLVNALCWAVVGASASSDEPICDAATTRRVVRAAVRLLDGAE